MHWYGALNFVRCHLLQNEQCEWKGPLQQRLPSLQHCLLLLLPRDWFVELVVSADLVVQLDLAVLVDLVVLSDLAALAELAVPTELAVPVELVALAKLGVLAELVVLAELAMLVELAVLAELVVALSRLFQMVTLDLAENCRLSLRLQIVPDELGIGAWRP